MDLRNILNILTEHDHEVKSNLPEANPGATSDLVKSQAKFKSRSDGSNAGMTKDFEVQSLGQFLASHGVEPEADAEEVAAKKDDDAEDLEEFYIPNYDNQPTDTRTKSGKCNSCRGDGTIYDRGQRDVIICPECDGAGFHDDRFGPVKARDESVYSESEFLGKGGKEPAVKYKDSTEADLADRMFRSKGPKGPDRQLADKDEGSNARELRLIQQLSGQKKIDEDDLDEAVDKYTPFSIQNKNRKPSLSQSKLSGDEYQRVKKLKAFNKDDWKWDSTQDLYVKVEESVDLDEAPLQAQTRKFPEKELIAYLDRISAKDKGKTDKYKLPYIHRSNVQDLIPIVDQEKNPYDLDKLAKDITVRPTKLLKQNEKMQHSDGTTSIFYNIGLPALTGLGYDEAKKEFVIINTCPGAGECKTFCYALKGGYVQWRASSLSQTRTLNYLWNDPNGFMEQLSTEIDKESRKADAKQGKHKVTVRWHDAGDFFSEEYLEMAYKLAATHPTVDFYAYTKMADVAGSVQNRPPNFKINFSMGARKAEEKRVDFGVTKHSSVVPKDLFTDLLMKDGTKLIKGPDGGWQWNSPEDYETFKERLANKYSIDPKTIVTYEEMMKIPLGSRNKRDNADGARGFKNDLWNVIVKPGDGDDSANRADVLGTYLLMH